jgi:type IV secretory pathway TrbF-like protein
MKLQKIPWGEKPKPHLLIAITMLIMALALSYYWNYAGIKTKIEPYMELKKQNSE